MEISGDSPGGRGGAESPIPPFHGLIFAEISSFGQLSCLLQFALSIAFFIFFF